MQSSSSSNNDDRNNEPAKKDTPAAEKEKLLREIQDLKCIIKQCEWSLQTLRFKDVEKHVAEKQISKVPSHFSRTQNVQVDLQYDLYRFAGFQCVKFRRDECVFNFTSTNEDQKDNTNAIQIFIKDEKANLGKWVMPMSIDMNYLLSKTPIDNLKNLTAFIKSCKHNVDCYIMRHEQFLSLKTHIMNMKHCTLQSDIGFKRINLELYGIHDIENDRYINLRISLLYHSDKARPHKIEFDTTDNFKLHDGIKKNLKLCLKEFKKSDLQTAFDKLTEDNSTFTWTQSDNESPLELNNTSSSDEEDFLTQLQSSQRKSMRIRQKKRQLQKKWNSRKRRRNINRSTVSESSENEREDDHSKTKVSHTGSPRRIPIKKKKAKKVTLKQEEINKNLLEETTPCHNPKVKLKQTKLNFQTSEITNSNTNEMSLFDSKFHNRVNKRSKSAVKLITSTPVCPRINVKRLSVTLSPSLEKNNITSIKTIKNMTNKLDESKSSNQLGNKKAPEKKTLEKIDRVLQSNTKTTGLSSRVRNRRRIRSMIEL